MMLTPSKINTFTFFKLPAAYWTGVRVRHIDEKSCHVTIKHKWINQNPFQSIYFAVQAMAAELSTGALVMSHIQDAKASVSMLVSRNESIFSKKAKGRITFVCEDGLTAQQAIQQTLKTGEGITFWMQSVGKDEKGDVVSSFRFEWSVKRK
ncbi:MAG: DUF4442 domain-containing protein [Flavobacteriaceae bacterium]|nr:DUF4442 domain-containing protein [Flavobacteriaceae bacterium]